MEIFDILGPHSHPSEPIDVKFCAAKRTQVRVGAAKFDLNRCNESPLRGEKPHFWPVSKNNTGSLPLRGNPAGKETSSVDTRPVTMSRDCGYCRECDLVGDPMFGQEGASHTCQSVLEISRKLEFVCRQLVESYHDFLIAIHPEETNVPISLVNVFSGSAANN